MHKYIHFTIIQPPQCLQFVCYSVSMLYFDKMEMSAIYFEMHPKNKVDWCTEG